MCILCDRAGSADGGGFSCTAPGGIADGSGSPANGGAGAPGAPIGALDADRLYAVAYAVVSTAMDRFVPDSNVAPARAITFQFETAHPADMPGAYAGYTLTPYTDEQKAVARGVFAELEALINVDFVEVAGEADPTISMMRGNLEASYGGRGRFVYNYSNAGGVQTVTNYDGFVILNQTRDLTNASGVSLVYHEIGHALTLRHPGNVDINPANAPGPPYLPAAEDNYRFSVMSYNMSPDYAGRPDSYMLYDVAALQYRFGANRTTRAGDTIYSVTGGPLPDVIWDGGGVDTLDGSAYAFAQYLDLRPGAFSTLGSPTMADTLAIAFGASIENAVGGSSADTLVGNDIANNLRGGAGEDTLIGGGGSDLADYSEKALPVVVFLVGADWTVVQVGGVNEDLIREIEYIDGGSGGDTLVGDQSVNALTGNDGDDFLFSNGFGADGVMKAGAGNDGLFGGAGNDGLFGGDGDDHLDGNADSDGLVGGAGDDVLSGGAGADFLFGGSFTALGDFAPGSGNDTLSGGFGDDGLWGFDGDDLMRGNTGNDYIDGGAGDDVIDGHAENDFLLGRDGSDTINGGAGFDYLYGGAGADTFIFRNGDSADWILDFSVAQGDRLRFQDFGYASFAAVPLVDLSTPGNPAVQFTFSDAGGTDQLTIFGVTLAQFNAANVFVSA